ncbi:MAG TPA: hypothetical protein VHN58_09645 [Croceicoccus sp.]|nr:hypothetical protein [Croceicoccus sp.]
MIIVRVELHSAVTGQQTELARMVIDNIGGTVQRGDYGARTLRGRSRDALDRAMLSLPRQVQREGRVIGHARLREHVWNLVSKALTGMNYGSHALAARGHNSVDDRDQFENCDVAHMSSDQIHALRSERPTR